MLEREWAKQFAQEWVAAWNDHDLERILSHYTDDFEMSSPLIIERMHEPSGRLKGKARIRPYWQKGLDAQPPLRFELLDVCTGVESIVLYYRSVGRVVACEVFFVNAARQIYRGVAHHGIGGIL